MKKKIVVALVMLALIFTSCGSSQETQEKVEETQEKIEETQEKTEETEAETEEKPAEPEAETEAEPIEIHTAGNWIEKGADTSDEEASYFIADVTDGEISIYFYSTDSKSLYWAGTAPETVTAGDTFVSEANHERTDNALLASSSDEKTFTFDGESLSYDFSMLGVTRTVHIVPSK